ncbi:unnamed protein product [Parnassius mnemosyne]|uniref:Uncharacterized protein n=1 Tax=Parnassius mnemosyne TaxID=213953 RepID=A0AAV1LHD8_9NEOP
MCTGGLCARLSPYPIKKNSVHLHQYIAASDGTTEKSTLPMKSCHCFLNVHKTFSSKFFFYFWEINKSCKVRGRGYRAGDSVIPHLTSPSSRLFAWRCATRHCHGEGGSYCEVVSPKLFPRQVANNC